MIINFETQLFCYFVFLSIVELTSLQGCWWGGRETSRVEWRRKEKSAVSDELLPRNPFHLFVSDLLSDALNLTSPYHDPKYDKIIFRPSHISLVRVRRTEHNFYVFNKKSRETMNRKKKKSSSTWAESQELSRFSSFTSIASVRECSCRLLMLFAQHHFSVRSIWIRSPCNFMHEWANNDLCFRFRKSIFPFSLWIAARCR